MQIQSITQGYLGNGMLGQIIVSLDDGSTIFVNLGSKRAEIGFQPDNNHYPKFTDSITIPFDGPFDHY